MRLKKVLIEWLIVFGVLVIMMGIQYLLISYDYYGEESGLLLIGGLTVRNCKKYILVAYENLWWMAMGSFSFFRVWNDTIRGRQLKLIRYDKSHKLYTHGFWGMCVTVFFILGIKFIFSMIVDVFCFGNDIVLDLFIKSLILQILYYFIIVQLQFFIYLITSNLLITFFTYGLLLLTQIVTGFLYGRITDFELIASKFILLYYQARMHRWFYSSADEMVFNWHYSFLVLVSIILIVFMFYGNKKIYSKWVER